MIRRVLRRSGLRTQRSAWAAWGCPTPTARRMEMEPIATIQAALDAGVTLLDTGDYYGIGAQRVAHPGGAPRTGSRAGRRQRQVRVHARSR